MINSVRAGGGDQVAHHALGAGDRGLARPRSPKTLLDGEGLDALSFTAVLVPWALM